MNYPRTTSRRLNQQGLVSLLVTMVLMMVISLIVLGFAQMSRREQRQALDRQLSTQAFLAAETAVNDAREAIRVGLRTTGVVPDKTRCDNTANDAYAGFNPVLNAANDVSYSCLLVSTRLENVVQTVAADGTSSVMSLTPTSGQISRLHLAWSLSEPPKPDDFAGCPAGIPGGGVGLFPKATDWACPYGVIRIDMVPIDTLDRDQLLNNNRVAFLYPTKANGTPTVSYANMNGAVSAMGCTVNGCTVDMQNIAGGTNYAMRIVALYRGGELSVSADNATGTPLLLKDAQVKIDATGRAAGVLRRVEARVALKSTAGSIPFAALGSGSSICKRFGVSPGQFRILSDIVGQDQNNPLCKALTVAPPAPPVAPPPVVTDPKCATGNDIVMVLDTSSSMYAKWETTSRREKLMEVARDFVVNTHIGPFNHMAIIGFDNDATMYAQMSSDEDRLLRAVDDLRNHSNTKYIPALTMARDDGWRLGEVRASARKVLVFVSDGRNDDSDATILSMANAMKSAGTTVYSVGINMSTADLTILQQMASTGKFASATSESQLERIMDAIGDTVRCQV